VSAQLQIELPSIPGWRDGLFKFTGFREDVSGTHLHGEIIWTGIATFHSGRKERVWYYTAVSINRLDVIRLDRNNLKYIEFMLGEASTKAGKLADAGEHGILLNWLKRKCRMAEKVEWQHWDCMDPEMDRCMGVRERGPSL